MENFEKYLDECFVSLQKDLNLVFNEVTFREIEFMKKEILKNQKEKLRLYLDFKQRIEKRRRQGTPEKILVVLEKSNQRLYDLGVESSVKLWIDYIKQLQ